VGSTPTSGTIASEHDFSLQMEKDGERGRPPIPLAVPLTGTAGAQTAMVVAPEGLA